MIVINGPPIFTTPPVDQSIYAGGTKNYTLPAITDEENDIITATLTAPLISFVSIVGKVIYMAPSINTAGGISAVSG